MGSVQSLGPRNGFVLAITPFFMSSLGGLCARLARSYGIPCKRPKVVMEASDICEGCGPGVHRKDGEVRATLRDSIWVSTLGLPFIPYDPMIEKIWVLPTGA